jgi:hypothetical protein
MSEDELLDYPQATPVFPTAKMKNAGASEVHITEVGFIRRRHCRIRAGQRGDSPKLSLTGTLSSIIHIVTGKEYCRFFSIRNKSIGPSIVLYWVWCPKPGDYVISAAINCAHVVHLHT